MADENSKRNPRSQDLTGRTFARLTVLGKAMRPGKTRTYWLCKCECGNEATVDGSQLKNGGTRSCGCLRSEIARARLLTHGIGRVWARTPEYYSWIHMRSRCNTKSNARYPYYGGRGIKVCARWDSFEAFLADMGQRPSAKHSLDRIDVNGDYTPENCRWTTQDRQMQNTRRTVLTEDKVREMWRLRAQGVSYRLIAAAVGTSRNNAQMVLWRKTWKHLAPPI